MCFFAVCRVGFLFFLPVCVLSGLPTFGPIFIGRWPRFYGFLGASGCLFF